MLAPRMTSLANRLSLKVWEISLQNICFHNYIYIYCLEANIYSANSTDCGVLEGTEADEHAQKADDGTGDKYEDFPDDEPGHPLDPQTCFKIASELKEIGNKVFKSGD